MSIIKNIKAREILDSRGNPTIEVDLTLDDNSFGRASVPSGASTGSHEAVELRDNDITRYGGKGVLQAVKNVNTEIFSFLKDKNFDQTSIDKALIELDGTPNKGRLGANAILGVSIAFAKAQSNSEKKPLYKYFKEISGNSDSFIAPVPLINILNGGAHAEKSTDFQEFMIVPHGAKTFTEAIEWGARVFHTLKKILSERNLATTVGDEGGYAPTLPDNVSAIELIIQAIKQAGFEIKKDISIALDVASTEFYKNGKYLLKSESRELTTDEMISFYSEWISKYPIVSIEDGLAEDDWIGYTKLTSLIGSKTQLVGDDLFVTNIERLKKGIDNKVGNSILIKLNQIGTVTETIEAVNLARKSGYTAIISHRSGETEDTTIAHFAVGLSTGQIKTGSTSRGERMAKYNELIRIEEELGTDITFAGTKLFKQ